MGCVLCAVQAVACGKGWVRRVAKVLFAEGCVAWLAGRGAEGGRGSRRVGKLWGCAFEGGDDPVEGAGFAFPGLAALVLR